MNRGYLLAIVSVITLAAATCNASETDTALIKAMLSNNSVSMREPKNDESFQVGDFKVASRIRIVRYVGERQGRPIVEASISYVYKCGERRNCPREHGSIETLPIQLIVKNIEVDSSLCSIKSITFVGDGAKPGFSILKVEFTNEYKGFISGYFFSSDYPTPEAFRGVSQRFYYDNYSYNDNAETAEVGTGIGNRAAIQDVLGCK
jgi:hypothetical protein